ncbi:hypothetical protein [Paenibacillus agilis]|uniref:Uncharacterized protein n=1 Tax=Paenibacillus agilis TaxID=3020863 RepID=A0A559ICZ2_9BACL|nr:hypothetical protein [Paenibacillus agilis]TVX85539.1 hypothetical protein FPZ44_24590 [Paenibacillus agilis]
MNKQTILNEMKTVFGTFNRATFVINGTEIEINKWNKQQLREHLSQWGEKAISSFKFERMGMIDVNQPIYLCFFKNDYMITNALESVIHVLQVEDVYSFTGLIESYKYVEPEVPEVPDRSVRFEYSYDFNRCSWMLTMGICMLGGCDTEFVYFENKADAIEKAVQFTNEGKEVIKVSACEDCHQEHMDWSEAY